MMCSLWLPAVSMRRSSVPSWSASDWSERRSASAPPPPLPPRRPAPRPLPRRLPHRPPPPRVWRPARVLARRQRRQQQLKRGEGERGCCGTGVAARAPPRRGASPRCALGRGCRPRGCRSTSLAPRIAASSPCPGPAAGRWALLLVRGPPCRRRALPPASHALGCSALPGLRRRRGEGVGGSPPPSPAETTPPAPAPPTRPRPRTWSSWIASKRTCRRPGPSSPPRVVGRSRCSVAASCWLPGRASPRRRGEGGRGERGGDAVRWRCRGAATSGAGRCCEHRHLERPPLPLCSERGRSAPGHVRPPRCRAVASAAPVRRRASSSLPTATVAAQPRPGDVEWTKSAEDLPVREEEAPRGRVDGEGGGERAHDGEGGGDGSCGGRDGGGH